MKGMGVGRDLLITEGLLKILEFFVDLFAKGLASY